MKPEGFILNILSSPLVKLLNQNMCYQSKNYSCFISHYHALHLNSLYNL